VIAIILAAGEGRRLRPHTLERPKCLVELAGAPLLAHQIRALERAGVRDLTIVTGHRANQIEALGYSTVHNPRYAETNMVASLMCAGRLFDGAQDLLVCYADLVYESRVVRALLGCDQLLSTTIDRSWLRLWQLRFADPLSDAETLQLDAAGDIVELGSRPTSYAEVQGQYMGLIKVRAPLAPLVLAHWEGLAAARGADPDPRAGMFMTSFLQSLIGAGHRLRAVPVDGGWLEIDSAGDLERYERLWAQGRLDEYCRLGDADAPA
jgi:choline kinase